MRLSYFMVLVTPLVLDCCLSGGSGATVECMASSADYTFVYHCGCLISTNFLIASEIFLQIYVVVVCADTDDTDH